MSGQVNKNLKLTVYMYIHWTQSSPGRRLISRLAECLSRAVSLRLGFLDFRELIGCTHDIGRGVVREAQVVFDGSAVLDLEEDHRRGDYHAAHEDAPARGKFSHIGCFLGIQAEFC